MKKELVIGIDTSNYTTSLALITKEGNLLANFKIPLTVKQGEHGLRQSDAVFNHIKNIPVIMKTAEKIFADSKLLAVGVSSRPRALVGSYMPCFLAGVSSANAISASCSVPLYEFSHQSGHIMAAIYGSGAFRLLNGEPFAALHVSGGTTEILSVNYNGGDFSAELVGGTSDLNAGQVIDRVGTYMGFSFPCGAEMEKAALLNIEAIPKRKVKNSSLAVNLSGLENLAVKLYVETQSEPLVSAFVFDYIEKSISAMCCAYTEKYGNMPFLFAGGVMSNSIIKAALMKKFNAYFAPPEFSSDNAVGVAELTRRVYISEN